MHVYASIYLTSENDHVLNFHNSRLLEDPKCTGGTILQAYESIYLTSENDYVGSSLLDDPKCTDNSAAICILTNDHTRAFHNSRLL